MKKREILELIESEREELIKLCSDILKIPSENPPGDSREVSEYIRAYLEEAGIETEVYETAPNRINLIAKIGNPEGKKLIYCGHSDTVPVGDRSRWDFDPFSGEIVDGYLQGRGASDMKSGLAGQLFAMKFLKEHGFELSGELTMMVVPDEETGSHHGVTVLLDEGLVTGDGCLIGEPSGRLNPTIGQKGSGAFELIVHGISGHASLSPLIGRNAITDAMKAISAVEKLTDRKIPVPEELQELVETSKRYAIEDNMPHLAEIFDRVSFNVGLIEGGTAANVIADKCSVHFDCRLPFGIDRKEFFEHVRSELDKLDISYELIERGLKNSANYTSPENSICKSAVDNISYVTEENAYGILQWACSDARLFREKGIPVLQYGPAELSTIHGFNERVGVDNLVECTKVYVLAALDFLNGNCLL